MYDGKVDNCGAHVHVLRLHAEQSTVGLQNCLQNLQVVVHHGNVDGAKALTVRIAHIRLIIDRTKWV